MANYSSHEHGVCSFVSSMLFCWALKVLLQAILPVGGEWLAELIPIILIYLFAAFCTYRE